jgi:hypothetical protein
LSINSFINGGKLISRLIITFKYIAKLINLYSPGFFFLTKNHGFLFSPLEYSSIPLLSRSLSIFIISNNNGFRHGKLAAYHALYFIILIIIDSKMSL